MNSVRGSFLEKLIGEPGGALVEAFRVAFNKLRTDVGSLGLPVCPELSECFFKGRCVPEGEIYFAILSKNSGGHSKINKNPGDSTNWTYHFNIPLLYSYCGAGKEQSP